MRTATAAASALAFAASATAQVAGFAVMSAPAKDEQVAAGNTYSIQWASGAYTGPVTISLLAGETDTTLQNGPQLASDVPVTNNKFDWSVECSLGNDKTYGIKIASAGDESLFQYSFPFHINNSGCGAASSEEAGYPTSVYSTISVSSSEEASYPTTEVPPPVYSTSEAPVYSTSEAPVYSTTAPPATTEVPTTEAPVYSTSAPPAVSSYPAQNTTVVAPPGTAYPTTLVSSATSPGTGYPTVVPVAGAGKAAAGSVGAFVAVAAAVFAL